ncbi:hypothetical protein GF373_14275, partial [bacterium]|nr:hypothetical protein [bacterium]
AIPDIHVMQDGEQIAWQEFTLTFYDYPGQTLYHSGLLARRDTGERYFFIGDSFTPYGIDDYCLLNRNLLHDGMGYQYGLSMLQGMQPNYYLINEHVKEPFRFSQAQLDRMMHVLAKREALIQETIPWDNANYGIDERWARLYPYTQTAAPGTTCKIKAVIFNHSNKTRQFKITLNIPTGWAGAAGERMISVSPRKEGFINYSVKVPSVAKPGVYVLTADVRMGERVLKEWMEGLVVVE